MTFANLKKAIAAALGVTTSDLTVDSLDLSVVAANAARQQAEQLNDFEFNRKLATMTVNTVTGGSLALATEYGTITPVLDIKTVVEVGLADTRGNFVPVEWTTVRESLERQRGENRYQRPRYPTDGDLEAGFCEGQRRLTFAGDKVFWFPKPETGENVTVLLDTYCYSSDWTSSSSDSGDIWLLRGWNYILWSSIVWLNQSENNVFGKKFIARQEGNLPPPQQMADAALQVFISNDSAKFDLYRRSGK